MGKGYLTMHLTFAEGAMPVPNARVTISDMEGNLLYTLVTDESGKTDKVELSAPPVQTQFDPNSPVRPYSRYIVDVTALGYNGAIITGVEIFDESSSILPIDMKQLRPGEPSRVDEYEIGEHALEMMQQSGREGAESVTPIIHREVFIPTHIRVHLGRPGDNARIITVPFVDYVKNMMYTNRRTA